MLSNFSPMLVIQVDKLSPRFNFQFIEHFTVALIMI